MIKQAIEDIQCSRFLFCFDSSAQLPEMTSIQKEVSELEARLDELYNRRSQSYSQQTSPQVETLREKERSASQSLNEMMNNLSVLASKIDSVSRMLASLQEKNVNQMAESIDNLQSQLSTQESFSKEYEARYTELNTIIQTLRQKTSATQYRIAVLNGNLQYRQEKSRLEEMEVGELRCVEA